MTDTTWPTLIVNYTVELWLYQPTQWYLCEISCLICPKVVIWNIQGCTLGLNTVCDSAPRTNFQRFCLGMERIITTRGLIPLFHMSRLCMMNIINPNIFSPGCLASFSVWIRAGRIFLLYGICSFKIKDKADSLYNSGWLTTSQTWNTFHSLTHLLRIISLSDVNCIFEALFDQEGTFFLM